MPKSVVIGSFILLQMCTGNPKFQSVVQVCQMQQQPPLGQLTQHAAFDILGAELTQHASSTQLPPRVAMLCLIHQLATLCNDSPVDQAAAQHTTAAGTTDLCVSRCYG